MTWRSLEEAYGIEIVSSRRVRDVYRVETAGDESCCVKKLDVKAAEVRFITGVLEHLRQSGFLLAPRLVKSRDGANFVTLRHRKIILTNWVEGRHPDFTEDAELAAAVMTLARFHKHAEQLLLDDVPRSRVKVNCQRDRVNTQRRFLQKQRQIPVASLVDLCEVAEELLAQDIVGEAIALEQQARAFAHGDYNYPNIVRNPIGELELIDFDSTALQVRLVDLVHILQRNYLWQASPMLRMVERYDSVRPLHRQEFFLLHALLHVPNQAVRILRTTPRLSSHLYRGWPTTKELYEYSKTLEQLL